MFFFSPISTSAGKLFYDYNDVGGHTVLYNVAGMGMLFAFTYVLMAASFGMGCAAGALVWHEKRPRPLYNRCMSYVSLTLLGDTCPDKCVRQGGMPGLYILGTVGVGSCGACAQPCSSVPVK